MPLIIFFLNGAFLSPDGGLDNSLLLVVFVVVVSAFFNFNNEYDDYIKNKFDGKPLETSDDDQLSAKNPEFTVVLSVLFALCLYSCMNYYFSSADDYKRFFYGEVDKFYSLPRPSIIFCFYCLYYYVYRWSI